MSIVPLVQCPKCRCLNIHFCGPIGSNWSNVVFAHNAQGCSVCRTLMPLPDIFVSGGGSFVVRERGAKFVAARIRAVLEVLDSIESSPHAPDLGELSDTLPAGLRRHGFAKLAWMIVIFKLIQPYIERGVDHSLDVRLAQLEHRLATERVQIEASLQPAVRTASEYAEIVSVLEAIRDVLDRASSQQMIECQSMPLLQQAVDEYNRFQIIHSRIDDTPY